jgi:hypothetical protein
MQAAPAPIRSPKVGRATQLQQVGVSKLGLISITIVVVVGLMAAGSGAFRTVLPLTGSSGLAAEASTDNLRMSVEAAGDHVQSGAELQIDVTIKNNRASAVSIASWECGAPISVEATLRGPSDPGRNLSDPLEIDLRALALTSPDVNASGTGVITRPPECAAPSKQQAIGDQRLDPGEEFRATILWRAELVEGVPASPGDVTITVRAAYRDAAAERAAYLPLIVSATVVVTDGEKAPISAAQALDAVLADADFGGWLRTAPSSTWTSANVFLQNLGPGDNGIVPDGPSWEVDVFRNVDGTRQWAISFVDPGTGQVRSVNLCDKECGTAAE